MVILLWIRIVGYNILAFGLEITRSKRRNQDKSRPQRYLAEVNTTQKIEKPCVWLSEELCHPWRELNTSNLYLAYSTTLSGEKKVWRRTVGWWMGEYETDVTTESSENKKK